MLIHKQTNIVFLRCGHRLHSDFNPTDEVNPSIIRVANPPETPQASTRPLVTDNPPRCAKSPDFELQ
jgi:hypothetical protein